MRRFWMILGLVALIGLPRAARAKEICYPTDKTPFCLNDPFSGYWELNGGLPVFGYPITVKADEFNKDTGKMHPTQWLERNRFEYHDENKGTPYEVLLGLLGKERLAQIGRDFNAEPRESGPKAGCLWFDQTGHNVCNIEGNLGFKTYWETHGLKISGMDKYAQSLQLFGFPLTEPKMETNSSGDTVLTQWFERARFEWHPNNPAEFKVLLGLLGKEVRSGISPQPSPTVGPVPSPIPTVGPQPTATPAPPPPSYNNCAADPNTSPQWPVKITGINKSGSPETVTIQNISGSTVDLSDWKICSIRGNQLHATLSGTIAPGQSLTINSQASGAIWSNNEDDDGSLYDNQGRLISFWND